MPQLLPARDPAALASALPQAVAALAAGQLVAFPTETVYGLGARADDARAVQGIFQAKGRPSDHPLIVHVADAAGAAVWAADLPEVARRLMDAFWPGPLTVIVPRRAGMGEAAAGGQDSIGLRCPAHPVAQALLREAALAGVPGVAAPSANRFGQVSPTRAAHVASEFPERDDLLLLDGGDCEVGIESAIVDCSRGTLVLLRPGRLTRAEIEAAAGEPLEEPDALTPRASGTLAAHYAPRAALRLLDQASLQRALAAGVPDGVALYLRAAQPAGSAHRSPGLFHRMSDDPAAAAHELFATLRDFDTAGATSIWVESPPDDDAWRGVVDRLRRAAAATNA